MKTTKQRHHDLSACIACGSQHYETLFSVNGHTVDKCVQCELVQTHPIPPEDTVDELYNPRYFEKLMDRKTQEAYYHEKILLLIEQYKTSGKMLEVGVGVGIFMELAHKRGWDIEGIDPSKVAYEYVSRTLRLPVHHGTLTSTHLPPKQFDVIILRHVLEHVRDPKLFVQELHRILRDDGIICLVVPNFGGLHARVEKEKWFHLYIPHHVAHYTKKTLNQLLTACRFEIVTSLTTDLSCSSYSVEILNFFLGLTNQEPRCIYVIPRELEPTGKFSHRIISKETIFNNFMARIGLGDELTVIVRKTK
jgi:2-polyprenyl-3-methyl-5-hydroxy-6-metoxy-1,4-benzoquinol methylase